MDLKVEVSFNHEDVYRNTANFKTHREYVQWLFKQKGYEVFKWNWDKDPDTGKWNSFPDGVEFEREDNTEKELRIVVRGTVGKNIRSLGV